MKKLLTIISLFVVCQCMAQQGSSGPVKRIGSKGVNKPLSIEFEGSVAHKGRVEVGRVVTIRKGPVQVVGARFIINKISINETSVFTLNIYEVKDGHPDGDGLYRPIKIDGMVREGKLDIDLSDYNIIVRQDFVLALSWPDGRGNISFGAGLTGSKSFQRVDRQNWERLPMKLAFSATVRKSTMPTTVN